LQRVTAGASPRADGGKSNRLQELISDEPTLAVSEYALGYTDTVRAAAPLPQYLAFVYGGYVSEGHERQLDVDTAARLVDRDAAAYPQWEPDALYAALRGGHA
jgi:hypothetical protein